MQSKKSETIGIRVTEELKEVVNVIAQWETRSLSQQAEHFIKVGIREYCQDNPELKERLKDLLGRC
jgi:hypothetical protein